MINLSGRPLEVNLPPGRNWGGDGRRLAFALLGFMEATSNVKGVIGCAAAIDNAALANSNIRFNSIAFNGLASDFTAYAALFELPRHALRTSSPRGSCNEVQQFKTAKAQRDRFGKF